MTVCRLSLLLVAVATPLRAQAPDRWQPIRDSIEKQLVRVSGAAMAVAVAKDGKTRGLCCRDNNGESAMTASVTLRRNPFGRVKPTSNPHAPARTNCRSRAWYSAPADPSRKSDSV